MWFLFRIAGDLSVRHRRVPSRCLGWSLCVTRRTPSKRPSGEHYCADYSFNILCPIKNIELNPFSWFIKTNVKHYISTFCSTSCIWDCVIFWTTPRLLFSVENKLKIWGLTFNNIVLMENQSNMAGRGAYFTLWQRNKQLQQS